MNVELTEEDVEKLNGLPPGTYATHIVEANWKDGQLLIVLKLAGQKTNEPSLFTITKEATE